MPLRADYTKNFDLITKMDPFLTVKYNEIQKQTTVAKKQGKHPTWNNRFCFLWEPALQEIQITSYDKDPLKNDYIGTGKGNFYFNNNNEQLPQEITIDQSNKNKSYGQVYVNYFLSHQPVEEILDPKSIQEILKQEKQQSAQYAQKITKIAPGYQLPNLQISQSEINQLLELGDFKQSSYYMQSLVKSARPKQDPNALIQQLAYQNKSLMDENIELKSKLSGLYLKVRSSEHQLSLVQETEQQQIEKLQKEMQELKQKLEQSESKLHEQENKLLLNEPPKVNILTSQISEINRILPNQNSSEEIKQINPLDLIDSPQSPQKSTFQLQSQFLALQSQFSPMMKSVKAVMVQSQLPLQNVIEMTPDYSTTIKFQKKLFEISDQVTEQDIITFKLACLKQQSEIFSNQVYKISVNSNVIWNNASYAQFSLQFQNVSNEEISQFRVNYYVQDMNQNLESKPSIFNQQFSKNTSINQDVFIQLLELPFQIIFAQALSKSKISNLYKFQIRYKKDDYLINFQIPNTLNKHINYKKIDENSFCNFWEQFSGSQHSKKNIFKTEQFRFNKKLITQFDTIESLFEKVIKIPNENKNSKKKKFGAAFDFSYLLNENFMTASQNTDSQFNLLKIILNGEEICLKIAIHPDLFDEYNYQQAADYLLQTFQFLISG